MESSYVSKLHADTDLSGVGGSNILATAEAIKAGEDAEVVSQGKEYLPK
jgi:hypothetical protein